MVDAGVVIISETNLGVVLNSAAIVDRLIFRAADFLPSKIISELGAFRKAIGVNYIKRPEGQKAMS